MDYNNERHNWMTPFIIHPYRNEVLFYGSNILYRSNDKAENWTAISGDLSDGEPTRRRPPAKHLLRKVRDQVEVARRRLVQRGHQVRGHGVGKALGGTERIPPRAAGLVFRMVRAHRSKRPWPSRGVYRPSPDQQVLSVRRRREPV